MKKYMLIMVLGLAFAPMVFKASNHAQTEKHGPRGQVLIVEDISDLMAIDKAHTFVLKNEVLKLEALIPESIKIDLQGSNFANWKPFGKISTKYHAEWLFNPDKLC